jgi:methylmalonyl-CoA mutase
MEKEKNQGSLFSEFPPVTSEQWEEKIQQDLKGADYEKKLVWKTAEGFKVKPYYRFEDIENLKGAIGSLPGTFPFVRGTGKKDNNWIICQDIESANPSRANKLSLNATGRGADAVMLNASEIRNLEDIADMLEGVDLRRVNLCFNSAPNYGRLIDLLKECALNKGIDYNQLKVTFDFDPISYALINGNFYNSQEEDLMQGVELLRKASETISMKVLCVNGQYFHNAGSTLVQELAFALASGNEYLSWYASKGLGIDEITNRMVFVFAAGGNYFMEIAKLRAARLLWAQIVKHYNPVSDDSAKMYIHSMTANWNKSIYDPYVNMLRTTTEAMSAAIGQADIITVLPFDMNYQEPDDFSLRIARNQQIILKEESNLDKVVDPGAGSYYIENLTVSLADAAWSLFLKVEEMGGMLEAAKRGFVQDEVAASAKVKKEDVAYRRTLVLGTNQHPNLNERMLEKIQEEEEPEVNDEGVTEDEVSVPYSRQPIFKTLEIRRASDEFEDIRLATEIWENEGNKRPSVFLLSIGNLAMRKARAGFTAAFFGCAGYEVIDNSGFSSAEEGVKAALKSKAEIIVICSSDEEYTEFAAGITRSLKTASKELLVVVAGYPKEILEELKEAGVDEFIHVRSNAFETLYGFQKKLEVML